MSSLIDSKKLRKVASAFATGITIITIEKEDQSIQGMTANSFLSVSLDPPLVAFSIRKKGSMFAHLAEGKAVGISILSDTQEIVSNQFAGRNDPPIEVAMTEKVAKTHIIDDCLAWYATEIEQIIPAGDHFLILCKVIALDRRSTGSPLLYYAGYQKINS